MKRNTIGNIGLLCWLFGAVLTILSFLIASNPNDSYMVYVGIFFLCIHLFGLFIVRETTEVSD